MAIIQCARCGKTLPHTEAFYSKDGQVCSVCHSVDEVKEGWRNPIARASVIAGVAGLLSLGANPFFLASIVALVGGTASIGLHARLTEANRRWLDDRRIFLVMGVLGLVLGLATLVWDLAGAMLNI